MTPIDAASSAEAALSSVILTGTESLGIGVNNILTGMTEEIRETVVVAIALPNVEPLSEGSNVSVMTGGVEIITPLTIQTENQLSGEYHRSISSAALSALKSNDIKQNIMDASEGDIYVYDIEVGKAASSADDRRFHTMFEVKLIAQEIQ